jgi:hypothetical protein
MHKRTAGEDRVLKTQIPTHQGRGDGHDTPQRARARSGAWVTTTTPALNAAALSWNESHLIDLRPHGSRVA